MVAVATRTSGSKTEDRKPPRPSTTSTNPAHNTYQPFLYTFALHPTNILIDLDSLFDLGRKSHFIPGARLPAQTDLRSPYPRAIMPGTVEGPSVSMSFANNFWGKDDAGVEPLLSRMHNAKQTCDELKGFYTGMLCLLACERACC